MSQEVSLPVDQISREDPPSEHKEAQDEVPPLVVPKNQIRGVYREATRKGSNSQLDTSQTHLSAMMSGRLMTHSMANLSTSEAENIQEIRRKREEERIKELNFFRNQKQAQIAKNLEKKKLQMAQEKLKDDRRKLRHESQKREIAVFKQIQTDRRKSQDDEWHHHLQTQRAKRASEIKDFLKMREADYMKQFKQNYAEFQKKMKEKARLKDVKEKGLSKAKEAENNTYVGDWEKVKAERTAEQKVADLFHSSTVQNIFAGFRTELVNLYDYYSAVHMDPYLQGASGWGGGGALEFRTFFAFANQFNILPLALDVKELKLVYRTVTKSRKIDKRVPVGLTFEEFEEMLFRITLKRKEFFGKVQPPVEGKPKHIRIDFVDMSAPDFHLYDDIKNDKDEYYEFENFHFTHLDGLFFYLDLPSSPEEMLKKLDNLRKEYHKAKPPRLKELPKKEYYLRIKKVNEIISERKEKMWGPSAHKESLIRVRTAKAQIDQNQREWGLANKRKLQQSRSESLRNFALMSRPLGLSQS